MIPGMNPRKMKQMMRQLGMDVHQIEDVQEVIIRTPKGRYVFEGPEVVQMKMQGASSWQISGEPPRFEEADLDIPEQDVALVAEQAGVSSDQARGALEVTKGDIAEAIIHLASHD